MWHRRINPREEATKERALSWAHDLLGIMDGQERSVEELGRLLNPARPVGRSATRDLLGRLEHAGAVREIRPGMWIKRGVPNVPTVCQNAHTQSPVQGVESTEDAERKAKMAKQAERVYKLPLA